MLVASFGFLALSSFYLITVLQWYSYKFKRIIFNFAKPKLHLYFFILPLLVFLFSYKLFLFYLPFYLLSLVLWHKKLDKKLVFTKKVKVFFILVLIFSLIFAIFSELFDYRFALLVLICAFISLKIYSLLENLYFYKKAQKKLNSMKGLKIILITASYGKTSIKNFLYELLEHSFKSYKTPRSVNTLMGIVKDINECLDKDCEIYIAEAGARLRGDILEITKLLNPHICIVGEIGEAHLEYFKTKENIRESKLEALSSKRLQKAFLHSSTLKDNDELISIYDKKTKNISSSLEKLEFEIELDEKIESFEANILGSFNAYNLSACILCARYLGVKTQEIKKYISKLKQVEHRLQIISKEPKFIIDDGFNGNLNGMIESYKLCKNYAGRKVIVSPGIMEVNEEHNIKLAQFINECFDLAIISANANAEIFKRELKIEHIILKDKNDLVDTLAKFTQNKDLILFSNDAPSFM